MCQLSLQMALAPTRVGCQLHHLAVIATIGIAGTAIAGVGAVSAVAMGESQKMACHLPRHLHRVVVPIDNRTRIEAMVKEVRGIGTMIQAGGRRLHETMAATGLTELAQEAQEA